MGSIDYEIKLLSRLVEIDTNSVTKTRYDECASIIIDEARENSLDVEVLNGEKAAKDGFSRPNLVITLDASSDVTLLLVAHFDVVPPSEGWGHPPFKLIVEDGKAYGRGSSDNKSGIAVALGAMRRLAKYQNLDINIKLLACVDEEVGGKYGLDYVVSDCGVTGDAALVLDAGPERLFLGASGYIWGRLLVEGIQGHAGYPFKAKNAIDEALRLLSELEPYRETVEKKNSTLKAPPAAPRNYVWGRFNVTMVKAWEKENIIPGMCEVRFDRRLTPEESVAEAEKEFVAFLDVAKKKSGCNASLEIINKLSGYLTNPDHLFVQTVSKTIEKTLGTHLTTAGELVANDGSFLAKNDIPVICFGPLRTDTRYHGKDEFVHLEDLKNTRDLIINLGKTRREEISPNREPRSLRPPKKCYR